MLNLIIKTILPKGWRQLIWWLLDQTAPRPKKNMPKNPGALVVAGFFSANKGLTRSAYLLVDMLERLGKKVYKLDISPYFFSKETLNPFDQESIPSGIPMIIHYNPPYLGYLYWRLGWKFITSRPIIGYWAWELDDIPKSWHRSYKLLTRIWAASTFCQKAFQKHTKNPVLLVPHLIEAPTGPFKIRKDVGIPDDMFVVLFTFNMGSGIVRKNPMGSIHAFIKAFGHDPKCLFIIKISDVHESLESLAYLKQLITDYPNIRIMTDKMSYMDVQSLMHVCDVYLSLHRSEGFGLTIAEALSHKKPVIATSWSGNMDFMDEANSYPVSYTLEKANYQGAKDLYWAEPNIEEAAQYLKLIKEKTIFKTPKLLQSEENVLECLKKALNDVS